MSSLRIQRPQVFIVYDLHNLVDIERNMEELLVIRSEFGADHVVSRSLLKTYKCLIAESVKWQLLDHSSLTCIHTLINSSLDVQSTIGFLSTWVQ